MLHFMNGTWIRRSFSTGSIHSAPSGELVYKKYDDLFQNAMINRGVINISYGVFDAQGLRMSMEDEHVFIPDLDQHLLEIVESDKTTTTEKTNRKNSYGFTHNSNSGSSNNHNSGEMVEESGSVNGGRRQSLRLTTNALAQLLRRDSFVSSQSPPTTPTSSPQSNAHHPHHHHTNNHNTNYNNNSINDISNNDIKTTNSSPSSPLTIPSHYSNSPASSAPSSPLSSSAYSSSPPTVVLPPLLQRKSMPTFSSSIFPEEMGCNLHASNPHCAFAVFDGHSGDDAAIYCKEHLCNHIITNGHYAKNIPKAMQEAFLTCDESLRKYAVEEYRASPDAGTTAVFAIIRDGIISVANCGDSRAVLGHRGRVVHMSRDHKPTRRDEKRRIHANGGKVKNGRVLGRLAVSRAIGDFDYKREDRHVVSAKPDIEQFRIQSHTDFIILACDGLWDVMSSEEAVRITYAALAKTRDLTRVCRYLVNTALRRRSQDNVTCMIVAFHEFEPLPPKDESTVDADAAAAASSSETITTPVEPTAEATTKTTITTAVETGELEELEVDISPDIEISDVEFVTAEESLTTTSIGAATTKHRANAVMPSQAPAHLLEIPQDVTNHKPPC